MDFAHEIISWYLVHKRDLPWRDTTDAYIIWLSEIILQQTRVEQGMPYFHRFREAYPTVADFANASEDDILKLWQGLGYYSRGRNMHKAARQVMEQFDGKFPHSYQQLVTLKGVGEYTAAAIASFAGNEAQAVVDGNVFRLLSRYFGIAEPINSTKGKKLFTELANKLIDKKRPGLYNQAAMEFGSLQCRPKNPLCETCPLRLTCYAFTHKQTGQLPVKLKTQKIRTRYFNYVVAVKNDEIVIHKRGPNDIWQNLHEFPLFETETELAVHDLVNLPEFKAAFGEVSIQKISSPVKHILSHQKLVTRFIELGAFSEGFLQSNRWKYVSFKQLEELAQPKLIFGFLKNFSKLSSN